MGYDVEHQPTVLPTDRGVDLHKKPDYRIEGSIFDCYAPRPTTSVENVYLKVQEKVAARQAPRIVVNLDDSPLTTSALHQYFATYPIPGLDEVVVLRGQTVQQIFP